MHNDQAILSLLGEPHQFQLLTVNYFPCSLTHFCAFSSAAASVFYHPHKSAGTNISVAFQDHHCRGEIIYVVLFPRMLFISLNIALN